MQRGGIIYGALLFAGGLTLGFWTGRSPPVILSPTNMNGAGSRAPSWTELRSRVQALRALWSTGADRERPETGEGGGQRGDRGGNGWMSQRSREESFLALQNAVAAGDTWELRNALRDLGRSGGDLLSAEQIQELGGLLGSADRDTIRDLSR